MKKQFTLIELLVGIAQYYCTKLLNLTQHKFSFEQHKTTMSPNIPLFLKEKGSARGKENFFSREKKFACPPISPPLLS